MKLYHYFERDAGPFRSISDLPDREAEAVLQRIRTEHPDLFPARRPADYLQKRRRFEEILRTAFLQKGGLAERETPHYLVVAACPFLEKWYEHTAWITVDTDRLDLRTLSFTYGDSHPTFSGKIRDGKEYRNRLYTYDEILSVIDRYGLPQDWNPDCKLGPECYIEVQMWTDRGLENWVRPPRLHLRN